MPSKPWIIQITYPDGNKAWLHKRSVRFYGFEPIKPGVIDTLKALLELDETALDSFKGQCVMIEDMEIE